MTSSKWFWAVMAFLLVFALNFIPLVGAMLLAPLAAVVLGALAGHSALRAPGAQKSAAVTAGAIVGVGALVASVVKRRTPARPKLIERATASLSRGEA